jgi:ketosteroid isomerase-like protein
MSVQEIESLAQQFCDAFNKKDLKKVLDMLSDDLEVFDHVPYRFDNKEQFAQFLAGAVESIASMNFGFRQPSFEPLKPAF